MTQSLIPEKGILRMWCDLYEPKSEAPVEGHLGAAMALISAAIGWKAPLEFGRNTEPCTINVILEGQSALARKTTTANTAHTLARLAVDPSMDDPGLLVHHVGHTSDAGLLELVAPKDETQARKWDKITPPGHLLVWDEFGSMLGDPGMNRKGGDWLGRTRTTIMSLTNGWHGGSKTRANPIHGSRCAISILATMTREELEQRISTGLLHDGFLGRFALIPMTPTGRRLAIPPEFTSIDRNRERDIVNWLRGLTFKRDAWDNPFRLLTRPARKAREDWYDEWSDRLETALAASHDDDLERAQAAAFGRIQALAMKVATVHAVSMIDEPETSQLCIDEDSVHYGQRIADFCLDEITSLAAIGGPAADQYESKVVAYLTRNQGGPITKRDVLRYVKYRGMEARHRWGIIESLHPDVVVIERAESRGPQTFTVRLAGGQILATQNGNGASNAHSGDSSVTKTLHEPA